MSPAALPDFLYEFGWATPDFVSGNLTVEVSVNAWKPKVHLDDITYATPPKKDRRKTTKLLRLKPVGGGQRVTAADVNDRGKRFWRVTYLAETNSHDILQAQDIIPVPAALRRANSPN